MYVIECCGKFYGAVRDERFLSVLFSSGPPMRSGWVDDLNDHDVFTYSTKYQAERAAKRLGPCATALRVALLRDPE